MNYFTREGLTSVMSRECQFAMDRKESLSTMDGSVTSVLKDLK